jgi:hypothetical protein
MVPGQISLYILNSYHLLLLFDTTEWFDKGIDDHLLSWYLLILLALERLPDGKHVGASGILAKNYIFFVLALSAQIRELEFLFFNYRFKDS